MNPKILKRVSALLAAAALCAFTAPAIFAAEDPSYDFDPLSLEPYTFQDKSGLMPKTANPVNLDKGTRLLWNGRDVTGDPALRKNPTRQDTLQEMGLWSYGDTYNSPYSKGSGKNWPPCDGFCVATPAMDDGALGDFQAYRAGAPLRVMWTTYFQCMGGGIQYLTFGCNEKTVKTVSISGLPDDAITAVEPDGIRLCFTKPGNYTMTYEITDSSGVSRPYPTKYTFEIAEAAPDRAVWGQGGLSVYLPGKKDVEWRIAEALAEQLKPTLAWDSVLIVAPEIMKTEQDGNQTRMIAYIGYSLYSVAANGEYLLKESRAAPYEIYMVESEEASPETYLSVVMPPKRIEASFWAENGVTEANYDSAMLLRRTIAEEASPEVQKQASAFLDKDKHFSDSMWESLVGKPLAQATDAEISAACRAQIKKTEAARLQAVEQYRGLGLLPLEAPEEE